jgi:hypothetical protein
VNERLMTVFSNNVGAKRSFDETLPQVKYHTPKVGPLILAVADVL